MYYDEKTRRPTGQADDVHEDALPTRKVNPLPPTPEAGAPPRRRRGCLRGCFVWGILLVAVVIFSGVLITSTVIYTRFQAELDDGRVRLENIDNRETFETTRILDRNGELLWEIFGEGKRTFVTLDQIPQAVQQATIAVEDDTFYENEGADIPSLIAALIYNLRNPDGRPVGASTITQQIVRHIAFDFEERTAVSYNRKAKEIVLSWIMTREYSKDQILELYLNEIYYGNLAYGIEAAAQTYYGKSASEMTIAESTLLAGLPQAPVDLDPLTYFEAAKQKQWITLNLMVEEGYLQASEVETVYQTAVDFAEQSVSLEAPHFATYVRQTLEEQFGAEKVANGGLQVTTTIDLRYQQLAEELARQHVSSLQANNMNNAALVALKPHTGEILAMLGSVDYQNDEIDGKVNVTLSLQQPGSSIKPVAYAAGLSPDSEGVVKWQAGDVVWDVPTDYVETSGATYSPVNYDGRFRGPIRLRAALANSYNIPAVLILQDIGVPRFLEFAQQMGLTTFGNDASRFGLSITLGGAEVTPLELAGAYAVFANEGRAVTPNPLLKVVQSDGTVLYEIDRNAPQEQVIDPRVAYVISDILSDDAARLPAMGPNNPLDLPFAAAAKTGTTNDFRDNWTMGYTPGLVVGVWTGNTDNSPMINVSGLSGAAPLWHDFMVSVYNDVNLQLVLGDGNGVPPTEFVAPQGLEKQRLCNIASIVPGATECSFAGEEWVIPSSDLVGAVEAVPTVADAVYAVELEPSVVQVPAVGLPPVPVEEVLEISGDSEAFPLMTMCHFADGTAVAELPPDAAIQVFLQPPRNPESLKPAYEWALANNTALLPIATCTEELLALSRDPNAPAVWRITSPKANEELDGVLPIVGTADFDPEQVQFYKIELGIIQEGDPNNVQWVTLGDTHDTAVVNGTLEMLHAAGLPPGDYYIRLIVILWDGNYVGEPYTVPFKIVR